MNQWRFKKIGHEGKPERVLERKNSRTLHKRIPLVKIVWRNHKAEEASWELGEEMMSKHPQLMGKNS